jgi:precorrin-6A/cobalt-precorrin-6A reductase
VGDGNGPVLVLGGTAEGFDLAQRLVGEGVRVITSLAGRVTKPRKPAGEVRVGGFGGSKGLAEFLVGEGVVAVIDATHPFAAQISANAAVAARLVGVPLLRLERPPWRPQPGDRWTYFASVGEAAAFVSERGGRVFLTIGRGGLVLFAGIERAWFLVRCVEPPTHLPPKSKLVLDRGPFTLAGEEGLIREHRIDLLVTKESGGPQTEAKLTAARRLGVEVAVIRRPGPPTGVERVERTEEAVAWLRARLGAAA